ncbi:MAG: hypothetical protein GXO83_03595 [Chlorobi bacterium]|nr:hypothetical protein [Chlorobiota bacterium]
MPRIEPFNLFPHEYKAWFEKYHIAYQPELNTIRNLIPREEKGLRLASEIPESSEKLMMPFAMAILLY